MVVGYRTRARGAVELTLISRVSMKIVRYRGVNA